MSQGGTLTVDDIMGNASALTVDDIMGGAPAGAQPAPIDYRGDPTKPNVDLGGLFRGFGQGAIATTRSMAAAAAGFLTQPASDAVSGEDLHPEDRPAYDAARVKIRQTLRGEPLPPTQNEGEEFGRLLGGSIPYAALDTVLGPFGLALAAGGTTAADVYDRSKAAGMDEQSAQIRAGLHAAADTTLFALMPVYGKVIEKRVGQPIIQEAVKALTTGSAFGAMRIVKNAIDNGTTDKEVDVLTGVAGDAGKGILLHAVMAMLGKAVGALPKEPPNAEANPSDTGTPIEPDQGNLPAREGEAVTSVRQVPSVPAEPQAEAVAGGQAEVSHGLAEADAGSGADGGQEPVAGSESVVGNEVGNQPGDGLDAASGVGEISATPVTEPARPPVSEGEPDLTRIPNEGESTLSVTSVKNRIVDEQRVARGLEPLMGEAARQDQTVWDAAMKKIDADPELGRRLVAELNGKPRTLSDTDNAILDHERVAVSNDYDLMNRAVNEAKATGDDARVAELEPRLASLRDYFDQVDTAGKAGGRESARGFRFRQLLVDDQYNLLPMERAKSAALGGRELTPEERAHVSELSDRIRRLEQAVSEQEKSAQEAKPKRQAKILSFLDSQADEARARLKSRMFRASAGFDPTVIADMAIIGARHAAHGIADFAEWSKKMADEFGDEVKPHLEAIFAKAHEQIDEAAKGAALEASKSRVKSEIADLEKQIETGTKREKKTPQTDAELEALKSRRAELRKQLTGTPEQIVSDAEKQARSLKRQIAQLENKQAAGDTSKRGVKQGPDTAEVAALKEKRRALLQEVADYRSSRETKQTPDERYQKTQGKRTAEFQRKIAEKDFVPAERAQRELNSESLAAKAQAESAKQEFQQELRKDQLARRTPLEKVQDTFVKWRRGFLLSSPTTLAKLTSAAVERIGLTPLEEAVGAGIGKLAPKLAERAPREGGASVKAEAAAITEGFTKGTADAQQTLKTGKSDLDLLYGKPNSLPPEAIDFLGHIHGALKAPVKRAEFARSFEKRTQWSIANGLDVTNPILQTNIALDAYKDANRSIFLQDNRVVDAYNQVVRTLEQPNKATGKPSALGKAGATVAKTLLPIVKVPTNIVSETFATAGGLPAGIVKVLRTGAENMSPAEADQTMRWLKKGSLGAVALLVGYFNPQMFGGYYQPGKRDEKDVNFGSVRLGSVDVPSMLVHNPLLEVFQLGATVRRVTDSKLRKKDEDTQGLGAGSVAGALGLLEETPFIREPLEISKVFDPAQRTSALGKNAESFLIPSGVQWIARQTDLDAQGNPVKRAPATIMENVQEGVPGLRKNLPVKKGSPQPVTVQK